MKGRVLLLQQDSVHLHYASIPEKDDTLDVINDYFNLDVKLAKLYDTWSSGDPKFKRNVEGIRILRQDPWENLCSFICSSNNNIKRITMMVSNLSKHYGNFIATHEGEDYYEFPAPEALAAKSVEQHLRQLGFGYRAPYIQKTAVKVLEMEKDYLHSLRELPYEECHEALLQFMGVGPKVADCVCLMSMDKHQVVPVDTHVWQIAQRDYKVAKKYSKLNKDAYKAVADHFLNIWGAYAGWAHSVMFTADLNLDVKPVEPSKRPLNAADANAESIEVVKKVKVEA